MNRTRDVHFCGRSPQTHDAQQGDDTGAGPGPPRVLLEGALLPDGSPRPHRDDREFGPWPNRPLFATKTAKVGTTTDRYVSLPLD